MNSSTTTQQIDFNRILRVVKQEFRIVELKELLNEFGYGGSRVLSKAQLQSRVEELLNSDRRNQVASSICQISRRLNGILSKSNSVQPSMVRTGSVHSSSYHGIRPPQQNMSRQAQFGMPPNFNNSYYDASKVRFLPLPFYDTKETLHQQTVLAPNYRSDGSSMTAHYKFSIPREYIGKLCYRETTDSSPRFEVQMRMCLCESDKEQPDAFPNNVKVQLNGALVNLPPLMNVQPQPGQQRDPQQKRSSKPVNITPYINPSRGDQSHQLTIEWQQDRHQYIFGIWIVYHVTPAILRDRLKAAGTKHYEETKALIRKNLGGGSEDDCISMDSLKISLVCPLSRVKMSLPVRSKNCTHLQCFDLYNYLLMNEKRPNWRCPVCNKPSSYNLLVVDSYFTEIIESNLTSKVNEVELLPNGGWRIVDEKAAKKPAVNSVTGTSAPPSIVKAESVNSTNIPMPSVSAPQSAKQPPSAPEIITLDDSDDSDGETSEAPPSVASSSTTKAPDSRKRTYDQTTFASSSNRPPAAAQQQPQDFGVITLGDSDDDEPSQPPANNPTFPSVTNESSTTTRTIPLFDENKRHFEGGQDPFSKMDSSTVAEISFALLSFMQNLEKDNKNCTA